mgnify:CR=1 FL=1
MSNLLSKASILLTPTATSDGKLHNIKPNTTTGDFTFTRGTAATRVNSNGLIESVASGLPRIDFTGGTGQVLLEPASTNLEVSSTDLSTGWSVASSATQQVETGINPFGVSGNIKRVSSATNNPPNWTDSSDSLKKQYTVTATDPASFFTFSVYVKSAGSTTVNIQLRDNTLGPSVTTGAISLTSDWQRVTISKQFGTTTTRVGVTIAGTDGDILLFGAQFENSSFATSLIETSGTTATRNKDEANSSGDSSLISSTEGVLYCEFQAFDSSTKEREIQLSDGTADNRVSIFLGGDSNRIRAQVKVASVAVYNSFTTSFDVKNFNKIAVKYKAQDFGFFINGTQININLAQTTIFSADTLHQLNLLRKGTGNQFEGKIKTIAVFKEALTNAQLISLTS